MTTTILACPICLNQVSRNGTEERCLSCKYDFEGKPASLTPYEVNEKIIRKEKIMLLDVRQVSEYEFAHIKDAKLMPLAQLLNRIKELDKNEEIIVYCHRGMRSHHAALFLKQKGFNAASMDGGIDRWSILVDEGIPRY